MDNKEKMEMIAKAYEIGEKSLIDFRRLFLYDETESEPASFHYDWSDILLNSHENFAIEAFRESAKSQYVIRTHTLYRLVYPSKEYDFIVFLKASQDEASQKLKEISREYQENPLLSANLVEVVEDTQKAFEAKVKDKNGEIISVRIGAYGKGSGIRGLYWGNRRPKLIVADDLQDLKDSLSDTIQENDYKWFMSDVFFLGKNCRIFMIGNNLGAKCLIEQVFEQKDELGFKTMRIPILDEKEESTWGSYWETEKVIQERENQRKIGLLETWYQNKMCIAISPDSQIFNKEDFRYYDPNSLNTKGLSIYTMVDLAISQSATADFTSICTIGVNAENHWFILDIKYGRWQPDQIIDNIFDTVKEYKPLLVGIEKVAFQQVIEFYIIKEMPKRNIFFSIKPLIADKKKELRIQAIQPRFKAHSVWFPEGKKFLAELETELLTFPKGIHDDLIDSLSYGEQIAQPPVGSWDNVDDENIPVMGTW